MLQRETDDFLEILEAFIEQHLDTAPLFAGFEDILRKAAKEAVSEEGMHFMPGFKITNLMADMVNIAATVSCEGWLSEAEAAKQLKELLAEDAKLRRQFRLEVRMERARYEPVMLSHAHATPLEKRNAMLRKKFARMVAARQSEMPLPHSFLDMVWEVAQEAIEAECFETYREGAMLQLFAEMLQAADNVLETSFDEMQGLIALGEMLKPQGRIWRSFAMKAARFKAPEGDPLHTNMWPQEAAVLNPAMVFDHHSHRHLH